MAIVQVSQITNRKGLAENLPQLAGAELGWAIDTRQLYIGNGTLESGAPVIGNTEILTEYSDVFAGRTEFGFGNYIVEAGTTAVIQDNTTDTFFTIDANTIPAFEVKYMIRRGTYVQTGVVSVVASSDGTGGDLNWQDPNPIYNTDPGVSFNVSETASTVSFDYTSTSTGVTGTFYYSISYFKV